MRILLVVIILINPLSRIYSQNELADTSYVQETNVNEESCNYWSIDLPVSTAGISIGNSAYFNGIRINFKDCGVGQINGLNVTFWQSRKTDNAEVNGISLGLAPSAARLNGLNLGIAALVSTRHSYGVNIGLLASVSEGDQTGFNLGGLAVVTEGDMSFINIGGLAVVSQGNSSGLNFGGLATVSEGNKRGINIGGLANVAEGNMYGLNLSGLANVSEMNVYGINFAGLAQVAGADLYGLTIAGLAIVAESNMKGIGVSLGKIAGGYSISGLHFTGYKIETKDLAGISGSIAWIETDYMKGVGISVFNQIRKQQQGITIGLVNFTEVLHGLQIGLINIAENNPAPFKILPVINAHF